MTEHMLKCVCGEQVRYSDARDLHADGHAVTGAEKQVEFIEQHNRCAGHKLERMY